MGRPPRRAADGLCCRGERDATAVPRPPRAFGVVRRWLNGGCSRRTKTGVGNRGKARSVGSSALGLRTWWMAASDVATAEPAGARGGGEVDFCPPPVTLGQDGRRGAPAATADAPPRARCAAAPRHAGDPARALPGARGGYRPPAWSCPLGGRRGRSRYHSRLRVAFGRSRTGTRGMLRAGRRGGGAPAGRRAWRGGRWTSEPRLHHGRWAHCDRFNHSVWIVSARTGSV